MAETRETRVGSTAAEEPVPRVAGKTGARRDPRATAARRAAIARRAAASSHPSYWEWLLSGEQNGQVNGNGSLNGYVNGNGHLNGNGHANGHSSNGNASAMRAALEEKALEGMTPTGLARRLGR